MSAMSGVTDWISTPIQPRVDGAVFLQLLDDVLHHVARDRKTDADAAARGREDRGVDADDLAFLVEGRAARVAVIHRGVDLQEIVIGPRADVAAAGGNDAGRHGAAEPERVADGDDPVPDPAAAWEAKVTKGKSFPSAFSSATSVLLSTPITFAGMILPSAVVTVTSECVVDDVVVGDDIPVGADEESGALRHRRMAARPSVSFAMPRQSEMPEEVIEGAVGREIRQALRTPHRSESLDVRKLDLDRDDGGFHPIDDIGEGRRPGGRLGRNRRRRRGIGDGVGCGGDGVIGNERPLEGVTSDGSDRHGPEQRSAKRTSIERHTSCTPRQRRTALPLPHEEALSS